jgi:hypothetical protein
MRIITDISIVGGSGNELLCFAASPHLALALSETFPRFLILAILLFLGRARVVVSHALSLPLLRGGAPLVVICPVGGTANDIAADLWSLFCLLRFNAV